MGKTTSPLKNPHWERGEDLRRNLSNKIIRYGDKDNERKGSRPARSKSGTTRVPLSLEESQELYREEKQVFMGLRTEKKEAPRGAGQYKTATTQKKREEKEFRKKALLYEKKELPRPVFWAKTNTLNGRRNSKERERCDPPGAREKVRIAGPKSLEREKAESDTEKALRGGFLG